MEEMLLDVEAVAGLLNVSKRMVWAMRDGGKMPAPVRIGKCVRWRRSDLLVWVAEGCPSRRVIGKEGRAAGRGVQQ